MVQASIQAKDLSLFTSLRALPSPSLVLTANLMPMRRVKKLLGHVVRNLNKQWEFDDILRNSGVEEEKDGYSSP